MAPYRVHDFRDRFHFSNQPKFTLRMHPTHAKALDMLSRHYGLSKNRIIDMALDIYLRRKAPQYFEANDKQAAEMTTVSGVKDAKNPFRIIDLIPDSKEPG